MSRPVNPIICDGCGKTKGESNAWWSGKSWPQRKDSGFWIQPGTVEYIPEQGAILSDLCGQECVLRFVSEQMGKQANG